MYNIKHNLFIRLISQLTFKDCSNILEMNQ